LPKNKGRVCVESDGSKKLKADIPASCIDSLFSNPPQSAMAEQQNSLLPQSPGQLDWNWLAIAMPGYMISR
jgi:hypothetical protein